MRLIGIDPGLQRTGWGVVDVEANRLRAIAAGVVRSTAGLSLAERLAELYRGLSQVLATWQPTAAAVEETFVNKNPGSTLKLGQARGIALLAPALLGLPVHEYPTNSVKSAVVGAGHASKDQVAMMVQRLLPGLGPLGADATDALAVAICHAHHAQTQKMWMVGARSVPSPSPRGGEGENGWRASPQASSAQGVYDRNRDGAAVARRLHRRREDAVVEAARAAIRRLEV